MQQWDNVHWRLHSDKDIQEYNFIQQRSVTYITLSIITALFNKIQRYILQRPFYYSISLIDDLSCIHNARVGRVDSRIEIQAYK